MYSQELEAGDTLYLRTVDSDRRVCTAFVFLVAHNELLGFVCVEGEVVGSTPGSQVLDLLPVGRFIIATDEANHCGILCRFNNDVRCTQTNAVMGKQGEEQRTQHTALWNTGVQGEGGGHMTAQSHRPGSVFQEVQDPITHPLEIAFSVDLFKQYTNWRGSSDGGSAAFR